VALGDAGGVRAGSAQGPGFADAAGAVFCFVHAQVGFDAKGLDVGCVFGEDGEADAGANGDGVAGKLKRLADEMHEGAGDFESFLSAGGLFKDDAKLVAAGAGNGIAAAETGGAEGGDLLEKQVANVVSEQVVDVFETVEIDDEERGMALEAAGTVQGAGEAVLEEAAVGEGGQVVVEGEVLVVLDLIFKDDEDHSEGNNIFGEVPDFALDGNVGPQECKGGANDEDESPGEESGDGDEGAGGGALVHGIEVEAASEVDGEQDGIFREEVAIAGAVVDEQEQDGQCKVIGNHTAAKGMVEFAPVDSSDGEGKSTEHGGDGVERPGSGGANGEQGDVNGVQDQQGTQQQAAMALMTVRNRGPHEEQSGPDERGHSNGLGDCAQDAGSAEEDAGTEVETDHGPGDEP